MASPPPSLRLNITNASTMAESSRQMHHGSVADSTVEPKELWNGKQREHNNNNQPADPESSRKQKVKSHLRRYRWWYLALVSTLVFFIIFLPVFFLAAIPAIIQNSISSAELPVRGGLLEAVSPTLVRMSLSTEMDTPAGLAAGLDAFRLDLYGGGSDDHTAFATLDVPAHRLKGPTPFEVPEQVVSVLDAEALQRFLSGAFDSARVSVGVRGSTVVRLGGGLAYPVTLDKMVEFGGLDGLKGVRVEELNTIVPPEADGTGLRGSLWVPNASPLALGLGNVTYDVIANGIRIGQTTIDNLRLSPGNQTVQYKGQLNTDAVLANIRKVLGALNEDDNLDFVVKGSHSTVNGERIGYLDEVMSKTTVDTTFDLCQAMKSLPAEAMGDMPMDLMMELPLDKIMSC